MKEPVEKKLFTYLECGERYGLCRTTIIKLARECNAICKIGKAARVNVEIMDAYILGK